jgi:ATP-dependent Lon protease
VAVALVAWYWDVKVCNDRVGITGDISLTGSLGGVLGLREKALGACYKLAGTFIEPNGREVKTLASLLIPMDNCIKGVVVEPLSAIDGKANRKVRHGRDMHSDLGQDSSHGPPPRPRAQC